MTDRTISLLATADFIAAQYRAQPVFWFRGMGSAIAIYVFGHRVFYWGWS